MKLPKWTTTVTPLSKTLALIFFTILPIIAFFFGMEYQKRVDQSIPEIIQTISPTTISPTTEPIKDQFSLCETDSDCPARNGCFAYQCVGGDCKRINMCNQE
jgi:hypothetical protein